MPKSAPKPDLLRRLIAEVKDPEARRSTGYQHPYSFYARQYGRSLKQIKRYAADGLPLDNPDKMGEYLTPRGRKPNEDPFQEDPPRPAPEDQADEGDRLAIQSVAKLGEAFLEGEGIASAVARISKIERRLACKLQEELDKPGFGNFREVSNRLGLWIGMLKTMGKLEKDTPGILEKSQKQIDIGEVQEGVTKLLLDIVGRLALIKVRCRQELAATSDPNEIEDFVEREISIALDPIRKCQWMPEEHRPAAVEDLPAADTPAEACPTSGPSCKKPSRRPSSSAKSSRSATGAKSS